MIKFFRKIRQNLVSEGKTGKYLKYAFGEIILVMIGILLALQVNNWNESRKDRIKETSNLKSLKSELITSLEELYSDYRRILDYQKSTFNVLSYIEQKPELTDSMYNDFYKSCQFSFFFPKTSTYEMLKSGSLELIKSDSLRMLITDIYESGYKRILTKVNTRRNPANILFPYYQENFRTKMILKNNGRTDFTYLAIPNDYQYLIHDSQYESLIGEAILGREMEVRDFERTIAWVEKCIHEIDQYLIKN
ncbi:MAG TPA: DUF6090 family protein, partial [Desulfobacterales bacterium]|nr:DUF6090 family protein [Desulfobacterales bacterium]